MDSGIEDLHSRCESVSAQVSDQEAAGLTDQLQTVCERTCNSWNQSKTSGAPDLYLQALLKFAESAKAYACENR